MVRQVPSANAWSTIRRQVQTKREDLAPGMLGVPWDTSAMRQDSARIISVRGSLCSGARFKNFCYGLWEGSIAGVDQSRGDDGAQLLDVVMKV